MATRDDVDIQQLLLKPREALDFEIKGWLDLSLSQHCFVLAKAIIALANSGGGYVLIGMRESDLGHFVPDVVRPLEL
ncbi:MAG TPA: hypothetical protein VMB81_16620, partial [Candidatus Sulfotelmatobacter sp.]|nr:hypothetical protein [Candidatus Sulfotelmatobacter sp.]